MSVLNGFNRVLEQFLTELCETFPELTDLRTIKTGAELLQKINPRAVLDQFMIYIGPYYVEIYTKNEEFFYNLDNISSHPEMQTLEQQKQESYMEKIKILSSVWKDLSDNNKDTIWKYFQSLLKLGSMASKLQEHKQILSYLKDNPAVF